MAQAKGIVASAGRDIERSVNIAKNALATLGIGLSAGAFGALVKGAIDSADHLNDLSKATNIAVEDLAGLQVAAKQSGTNLDGVAQAVNKLSVNIGKEPAKFRQLGISAQEPLEAFKQLADIYVKLEDPQQRAAVMAAALGKSWADAAPLLAEGGKKIGELVERGSRLSGVTKEIAEQADEFNDKLVLLTGTGGLMTRMVGSALPLMNDLADSMLKAGSGAETFKNAVSPLSEILRVLIILGSDVGFTFEMLGKDMARAFENIQLIARLDFAGSRALGETFRKDAQESRQRLDEYQARIRGLGLTGQTRNQAEPRDPAAAAAAAAAAKKFLGGQASGKTLADLLNEQAGVNKDFLTDWNLLQQGYIAGKLNAEQYAEAVGKLVEKQGFAKDIAKQHAEELKRLTAAAQARVGAEEKQGKILAQANEAFSARRQALEAETALIGADQATREKAVAFRQIDLELQKQMVNATPGTVGALYALADAEKARLGAIIDSKVAREKAHQASEAAAEEWKRGQADMWRSIDRTAHDTFVSIFDSGKNAFERLRDTLKNTLYDLLYQMTIRPWIVNIAAAVSGGSVATSAFGGGFNPLGLLNGGGGGLGFPSPGSFMNFGGGLEFAGGFASTAFAPAAEAAALIESGTVGFAGAGMEAGALGLSGAASAIPWVGAGLLAANALGLFGDDEDEPPPGYRRENWFQLMKSGDRFHVGSSELPDPQNMPGIESAFFSALNDPSKYDPKILDKYVGQTFSVAPGQGTQALAQQLLAAIEPAGLAVQLRAANDPFGYAGKQQADLAARLGSSARTVQEWRDAFLSVIESLTPAQIEDWKQFGQLIEQTSKSVEELTSRRGQLEGNLASVAGALPGQLGITGLQDAAANLATSEYVAPLDRYSAARAALSSGYGRAAGGDLDAVRSFPQLLQSTLGIGRDVFASGPEFASLFVEGNRMLQELIARQQAVQADILRDVPSTILQASADQVGEIRKQTNALVVALGEVKDQISRLEQGLAA